MKNHAKKIATLVLAIATICLMAIPSFAINGINDAKFKEKDCWVISRKASYVNPDTGLTVDGGDDTLMGMAMSNSLVDKKMLLEHANGKYYITFSMVGMSFSKDFKVEIIGKDGKIRTAKHAITYTNKQSLGTQHFRVEVRKDDKYISPSLFVLPMGRRVQFFLIPELASARNGCGPFVSEFYSGRYERETQKDMSGFIDNIPQNSNVQKPVDPGQPTEMTTVTEKTTKPIKTEIETVIDVTQAETALEEITETEFATDESALESTATQSKDDGMSTGAKVGIAVCVIAALAIIGGVVYIIITKKKA